MKVELKSITHSKAFSEETEAFKAKVYVNGKHVGDADNEGRGGPTSVHVAWTGKKDSKGFPLYTQVNKEAVGDLIDWAQENHKYGIEGLIDDLLYEELHWRDFQSLKRSRLLYFKEGKIWSVSRGSFTSVHIKSGKAEEILKGTTWWKDSYVFLNNIKKPEFIEKYLETFRKG